MTPEETKAYILAHYEEQTSKELAEACFCSLSKISQLSHELDIIILNPRQKKIRIIKESNGLLTSKELAKLADCTVKCVLQICYQYKLPFIDGRTKCASMLEKKEPTPELTKRQQELESHIARYTSRGFSRFEALKILHEIAEYLVTFGEWKKSNIERPKAIYANQTRDQLIDEILSDSNGTND